MEGYRVDQLRVIATSAVREAANGGEFLKLAKDKLGLNVEVIPPEEEGRLSFLSAARHLHLGRQHVALADLGGGSAEIVFAVRGLIEDIYSLPIGAVRMTEGRVLVETCESLLGQDPADLAALHVLLHFYSGEKGRSEAYRKARHALVLRVIEDREPR